MSDVPARTAREALYSDPYLTVAEHHFEQGGDAYRYFIKEEPDFAVVGAVTEEGEILMVRQFRPGPGRFTYDVPGGMIDAGDRPIEAARKELLEETGYTGDLREVAQTYVTAYSTAKKHIFLATGCRKVAEPEAEPNMIAELRVVSHEEFTAIMRSGDVLDLDCMLLLAAELGLG